MRPGRPAPGCAPRGAVLAERVSETVSGRGVRKPGKPPAGGQGAGAPWWVRRKPRPPRGSPPCAPAPAALLYLPLTSASLSGVKMKHAAACGPRPCRGARDTLLPTRPRASPQPSGPGLGVRFPQAGSGPCAPREPSAGCWHRRARLARQARCSRRRLRTRAGVCPGGGWQGPGRAPSGRTGRLSRQEAALVRPLPKDRAPCRGNIAGSVTGRGFLPHFME